MTGEGEKGGEDLSHVDHRPLNEGGHDKNDISFINFNLFKRAICFNPYLLGNYCLSESNINMLGLYLKKP